MAKKLKGGRKTPKKIEGGPFWGKFFPEKSRCQKRGILWSRPVLYVTRETFLVQLLGPTGTIWRFLKIL